MRVRWLGLVSWPVRPAAVTRVISARRSPASRGFWQGVFAAGLGLALPWLLLGLDLRDESAQLDRQRQQTLREQGELQNRLQALQVKLLPRDEADAPALLASGQPKADRLILHRLALQHQVQLELLKSGGEGASSRLFADAPTPAGPPPAALRDGALRIELRGSYGALFGFVQALGEANSLWALKQLHLMAGAQQEHRLSLRLEALPAQPRPVASVARPAGAMLAWRGPDPFAAPVVLAAASVRQSEPVAPKDPWADVPGHWRPEFVRERQPLEAVALRDLAFAGTLRHGPVWLALMRGRDAVHTVKVGDYLGPDLGRVQRIDEDGLELRELRRDGGGPWTESVRRWRVGGAP